MKTTWNSDQMHGDDAMMRELLLLADRQAVEPPQELVDNVRAKLHENTMRSPSLTSTRMTAKWTRRACFVAAGTAAALAIVALFHFQSSATAWAQMAKAVNGKPWMRFIKKETEQEPAKELWLSFPREIAAMRLLDYIRYDDYRAGVRYEYNPQLGMQLGVKKLFRLQALDGALYQSVITTFRAIARGDDDVGKQFGELHISTHCQRTVEEQGKRWVEYELSDSSLVCSVVIRVDPETNLPTSLTFVNGKEREEFTVDYPEEGPPDIYALGAPRDTIVEDHIPSRELRQILAAVDEGRQNFDDYLAIVGHGSTLDSPKLVWRKGDQWRIDLCKWLGSSENRQHIQNIGSESDMAACWLEYAREFDVTPHLLCDGRQIYQRFPQMEDNKPLIRDGKQVYSDWSFAGNVASGIVHNLSLPMGEMNSFIEDIAYPTQLCRELTSVAQYSICVDPKGENGPSDTVRVEVVFYERADHSFVQKRQYWLAPQRGYVVVRLEYFNNFPMDDDPLLKTPHGVYEYDGFRQSPRGVWYPTVIRWKNVIGSENERKPAGVEPSDQTTYFHLDFHAKLPDELFTRALRFDR